MADAGPHTPGQRATKVTPSSWNASAYCTVSMLRAVLETLYAGVGVCWNCEDRVIDPKVEVLSMVSMEFMDAGAVYHLCVASHVDDLLQIALSDQGQQGGSDVLNSYDIDVQVLAQVVPIWPSVSQVSCIRAVS